MIPTTCRGSVASPPQAMPVVADRFNIQRVYTDYRDLAADPEMRLAYHRTNSLHCEMAVALARAGKHVICEKPLASRWTKPI